MARTAARCYSESIASRRSTSTSSGLKSSSQVPNSFKVVLFIIPVRIASSPHAIPDQKHFLFVNGTKTHLISNIGPFFDFWILILAVCAAALYTPKNSKSDQQMMDVGEAKNRKQLVVDLRWLAARWLAARWLAAHWLAAHCDETVEHRPAELGGHLQRLNPP